MKKKEIIIIGIIAIVAVIFIGLGLWQRSSKGNDTSTAEASASAETVSDTPPKEKAKGQWVGVVHRNHVALWFDSGINDTYAVTGDYGVMHIEVKDGKWHVSEVECPNQTCKNMGWDDGTNFMPITCIPNNIMIGTTQWVESYFDQMENQ